MADKDPDHQKPQENSPHGMEPYDLGGNGDLGALSKEQQEKLNKYKIKTRIENEKYLREHPEVECLVSGFLQSVLTQRPENIREFAAEHFTDPDLPTDVERKLEARQQKIRQNRFLQKV
ncbi:RIIa domain-containing protein 1-like [Mya arenaria]|uniref:RIIa domain-containing protein 1-like n=1 Tax=Mya arenaria TaxID=6604 RepID=UPI0022DEA081|nr:RIIa domain-containing protein 1-like [Mya arenaria]XP_052796098.1 RIIa domain-containing protein 1-like [Mya arenaria]